MLLVLLLIPIVGSKKTDPSRNGWICVVSPDTAAWSKFSSPPGTPTLPRFEKQLEQNAEKAKWEFQDRYATSKLLGQLFISHYCPRVYPFPSDGKGVTFNVSNPGFCFGSELGRETVKVFKWAVKLGYKKRRWHGVYVEDGKIQPMPPLVYKPEGQDIAARLYDETIAELQAYMPRLRGTMEGLRG
ncbi:hypothetical protein QBC44DRAFT_388873 [Cladorrhinum sp. PSN332]|nr:hypothetical protein QBC44DRAFT_388873 [Cladorrhinum sp. PSN332]